MTDTLRSAFLLYTAQKFHFDGLFIECLKVGKVLADNYTAMDIRRGLKEL